MSRMRVLETETSYAIDACISLYMAMAGFDLGYRERMRTVHGLGSCHMSYRRIYTRSKGDTLYFRMSISGSSYRYVHFDQTHR